MCFFFCCCVCLVVWSSCGVVYVRGCADETATYVDALATAVMELATVEEADEMDVAVSLTQLGDGVSQLSSLLVLESAVTLENAERLMGVVSSTATAVASMASPAHDDSATKQVQAAILTAGVQALGRLSEGAAVAVAGAYEQATAEEKSPEELEVIAAMVRVAWGMSGWWAARVLGV